MNVSARALWFIESHLSDSLSLETIAAAEGVPVFHLARAFSLAVGCGPAAYVRSRRLGEAARKLAAGAPDILALALESGYGSHEAFTRAFRDAFGVTPQQLRAAGNLQEIDPMTPKRLDPATDTPLPPPRRIELEPLRIAGLAQRHEGSNAAIPEQWNRFMPWLDRIPGRRGPDTFGVVYDFEPGGAMHYLCGVQVEPRPRELPAPLTFLQLPAGPYAVFHHAGHVAEVAATWTAIWNDALPRHALRPRDGAPAFERYGPRFDPRTGTGGFDIWLPLAD